MKETAQIPNRFYSLDAIRGLAALCVVLWHWQHFFYFGTISTGMDRKCQPFFGVFYPFYLKGYLAVTLFFSLSGFIFFWLYSKKISEKKVSGWEFFILRFSRLYPLHLITLLIVGIEQMISRSLTGMDMVYACNDFYHFILNIFFISFWGFQKGFSFNGPIWSVSIEVMLYFVFFFYSFLGGALSIWMTICLAIASLFIRLLPYEIRLGLFSFFMVGAMFLSYERLIRYDLKIVMLILASFTGVLWFLTLANLKYGFIPKMIRSIPEPLYLNKLLTLIINYFASGILFPLTLLSLSLVETYRGKLGARFRFLGDISYSTYLIHFPLQLLAILIFTSMNLSRQYFYTNTFFFTFFIILLILSYLSFHYFERPVQRIIRNKFLIRNKHRF